jgi:hypothetical protein
MSLNWLPNVSSRILLLMSSLDLQREGKGPVGKRLCNIFWSLQDTFKYNLSSSISTYLYAICPCCVWRYQLLPGTWPPGM